MQTLFIVSAYSDIDTSTCHFKVQRLIKGHLFAKLFFLQWKSKVHCRKGYEGPCTKTLRKSRSVNETSALFQVSSSRGKFISAFTSRTQMDFRNSRRKVSVKRKRMLIFYLCFSQPATIYLEIYCCLGTPFQERLQKSNQNATGNSTLINDLIPKFSPHKCRHMVF